MSYKSVIITRHLQERLKERFPNVYDEAKYGKISNNIKNIINSGEISRSFLNDSRFMNYLYDTYGYGHTYDFVIKDNIVFVIKKSDGKNIAVTCLNKKEVSFSISKATKFKKKVKPVKNPVGYHNIEEIEDLREVDINDLLSDIRK